MSAAIAPLPPHAAVLAPPGSLVVIKFGGTSLATSARIRRAASRVGELRRLGHPVVAVVSATGHSTDRLLQRVSASAGYQPAMPPAAWRELDRALATGEALSAALLAGALLSLGIPARSLGGGEAGILAEGEHGAGSPVSLSRDPLQPLIETGCVPVVAGFQAVRADGETVTLGRGGSDLTAVFLGAALGAGECQIVTDVDGVYTADPRVELAATWLPALTHRELVALTAAGAVVVHADAARRAAAAKLPLRIYHHHAPLSRPGGTVVLTPSGAPT